MSQAPLSPCNLTCKLSPDDSICVGCGRTVDEIVEWGRANSNRQNEIVDLAFGRLTDLSPE